MPCDTRYFTTLDLKNVDPKIFVEAMKRLGYADAELYGNTVQFNYGCYFNTKTGELQLNRGVDVADIKRGYQREQAIMTGRKAGWTVTVNKTDKWKLNFSKR